MDNSVHSKCRVSGRVGSKQQRVRQAVECQADEQAARVQADEFVERGKCRRRGKQ